MEFKITEYNPIQNISFNYEELKQELVEKTEFYQHIVYTDDNIKSAKTDRADLNRLKKALNDKRLEVQKEILKPFEDFKGKVDELIAYINKSVENVDLQVKEYEAKVKAEKEEAVRKKFEELNPFDWLKYEQIADSKWLNASSSMSAIETAITLTVSTIETNLEALKTLEYSFEATERYKQTLSTAEAMLENKRLIELAFKKAEMEQAKAKEEVKEEHIKTIEEEKEWMTLKVKINGNQYDGIAEYLNNHNIEWRME